jgi:hypothetical protein
MFYHYKGHLIVYSDVQKEYTVYLSNGLKCVHIETLNIATGIINLMHVPE